MDKTMQHSTGGSMSRVLNTEIIIPVIENLVKKACYELDDNLMCSFRKAYEKEESKIGKETIKILIDNGEYAKKNSLHVAMIPVLVSLSWKLVNMYAGKVSLLKIR